jgi:DNA-binding MarR family transcriptional regulator
MTATRLGDRDYEELLAFRSALRRFLRWSEDQAAAAGLTGQQHQLLLAIRGHPGSEAPTIGDIADHLVLKHHSVVELIDRAEQGGLVERRPDSEDRRVVRLWLTSRGRTLLARLSETHVDELRRLAPIVRRLTQGLEASAM